MTDTERYFGKRRVDGATVVRRVRHGREYLLPLKLNIENHSPTGFEWSYGGSGPAQLALAILADALHDDRRAQQLHQRFKWLVVARFAKDYWELTRADVLAFVDDLDRETSSGRRLRP